MVDFDCIQRPYKKGAHWSSNNTKCDHTFQMLVVEVFHQKEALWRRVYITWGGLNLKYGIGLWFGKGISETMARTARPFMNAGPRVP